MKQLQLILFKQLVLFVFASNKCKEHYVQTEWALTWLPHCKY